MTTLTWIVTFLFTITEYSFIKAQLFEPFLFSKTSGSTSSCTNHFIGVDVIICGSLTQESLDIKAISDGYQMAKIPVEDCYHRINEFNLVQFKKTIFIFTPESELELQTLAVQRRLLANNPVTYNSTLLLIVIWSSTLVSKLEQNTFEKYLESLANNFLLNEYVFILYQRLLPDGGFKTTISELYSVKNITFVQTVPYLKNENELDCNIFSTTSLRRNDFKGAVIRATAVVYKESVIDAPVATYSKGENADFIEGLGVFDLFDIRDLLNFSIQAVKGSQDIAIENDTVVGIGRQLMEDEADVSILHSYTLLPFVSYLTPLLPLGVDRVYAFFLQPQPSSVRNIYHEPFKSDLWVSLCIAWLLILFCVFTIGLLERQLQKYYYDEDEEMWPLEETNLWAVSVIGQRSFYTNPKTMAMRIVFLSGLYMSMITFTSYSAAIISSLTQETLPINALEDLVDSSFIEISDPTMFYSSFLDNNKNIHKEDENNYVDDVDATKRITNGGSMFLTTFDSLCLSARELAYPDKKICNVFSKVPVGKVVLTSGFYVKKRCPFKEAFNSKLLIVMERGLNNRYINNYYLTTLVKCTKKTTSYRENLGLNDVFTAFLTLGIGCGISLMLLLLEKIFVKFRNPRYQP